MSYLAVGSKRCVVIPAHRALRHDPYLQLKIDQRVFLTPSRKKLDVNVVQSNYHIELTPRFALPMRTAMIRRVDILPCSEVGNYDRVVIQEIIKEIAQTQQVDVSARHRFKGAH